MEDAAQQAAKCCDDIVKFGSRSRCRVDFDTSVGDETYTILKSSLTFGVEFINALSYALIPGAQQLKQDQMMRVIQAKSELVQLEEELGPIEGEELKNNPNFERINQLQQVVINGGIMEEEAAAAWKGPVFRVYFPDEGSAALARRDWKINTPDALVPPCVGLASVGGVQSHDTNQDIVNLFFCPKASEAEFVEDILYKTEAGGNIVLSVFLNPNLVDMGVTGFGMAGRMLRERLLDDLAVSYYLRTLQWGAMTRAWPSEFSVWQEDENKEGGYRLIKSLDNLPSNPEVEDIYDIENGLMNVPKDGLGFLNALGDFVNGMTRL